MADSCGLLSFFFFSFFSIFSVVHSVNSPEKAAAARVECRTAGASSSPGLGSTRFLFLSLSQMLVLLLFLSTDKCVSLFLQ